jgi:hypothetical protein
VKVCIVSSCGGHLTEVRCLLPAYRDNAHFYVLNDHGILPADMQGRTYFIAHSERDWKFLLNLWVAFHILRKERPAVLLTTGAGPARSDISGNRKAWEQSAMSTEASSEASQTSEIRNPNPNPKSAIQCYTKSLRN